MNATATMAPAGPQYMRALERANKVRLARADLKRRVTKGEVDVAEVILGCPWEAKSMPIAELLMSQRRWGESRCRKFLAMVPMSETKTVGSMTERQRRTLARMLGATAARPEREPAGAHRRETHGRETHAARERETRAGRERAGREREPVLVG